MLPITLERWQEPPISLGWCYPLDTAKLDHIVCKSNQLVTPHKLRKLQRLERKYQDKNVQRVNCFYFQNDREMSSPQSWALICDTLLSRSLTHGTVFQLTQGDVSPL